MKISIIIATWNAGKTLQTCLNSITPQLRPETELIIIDGGSIDNTLDIINKNREHIDYTISEKDKGIYDAWNKGVKAAKGEWVAFIGADDILLPNAIQTYIDFIKRTGDVSSYDYICAHNEYVDMNGKLLKVLGTTPVWNIMKKTMAAAHVASLHNRKKLFETIGEYDLSFKICADYELLLRKKDKLKFLFIDNNIARMKVGGMSFSMRAIKECYKIRKKHRSVPSIENYILYITDVIAYNLFKVKKKLQGGTIS